MILSFKYKRNNKGTMAKSVRFEKTLTEVKHYELTDEEKSEKRLQWRIIKSKITQLMSLEQLTEQLKIERKYQI